MSGEPIKAIACFFYDRFTREPDTEGGAWLQLMRSKGIDLHETFYDEPPRPLYQIEHMIRDAWNKAALEVEMTRKRILDAFENRAARGLPPYGGDYYGWITDRDEAGRAIRWRCDPTRRPVLLGRIRDIIDGSATPHSTLCWMNDNGYTNLNGNHWTSTTWTRFLCAPRLAGMFRLRVDLKRAHDPSYEGDLCPKELLLAPGEDPPAHFAPVIEPLISYAEWLLLQEAVRARAGKRGRYQRYWASSFVECGACGQKLIHGTRSKRLRLYRCPKRHLEGMSRSNGSSVSGVSHDGKRHSAMSERKFERVLSELILAALDARIAPSAELVDVAEEFDAVVDQLRELDQRIANLSYMLAQGRIKREEYDEWFSEIDADREPLLTQSRELAALRVTTPASSADVSLRDLWPNMPAAEKALYLPIVFEKVVLKTAEMDNPRLADRFEFSFREGYEPPAAEVAALLDQIQRETAREAHNRTPTDVAQRMLEMHDAGLAPLEIAETLEEEGIRNGRGEPYRRKAIDSKLRTLHQELGHAYTPNKRDLSTVSYEERELMQRLWEECGNYSQVARDLDQAGIRRPSGEAHTGRSVSRALAVHRRNRGLGLPQTTEQASPRNGLSQAMRAHIWSMSRERKMSLREIAAWLEERRVPAPRGSRHWHASSVRNVILGWERKRSKPDET